MTTAKRMMAGAAAMTILVPAAFAQQGASGLITKIDRLHSTISIQEAQGGTVGSSTGPSQEFNVKDTQLLDSVHAGDKVNYSATDSDGAKTITKLQKE